MTSHFLKQNPQHMKGTIHTFILPENKSMEIPPIRILFHYKKYKSVRGQKILSFT